MKDKDEVFQVFSIVERPGRKVFESEGSLRTDNGGSFESVETVIAFALQKGLKLHQMDVATGFLNGELKEEVFMKQPEVFFSKGQEHLVYRLKRSIYSFKQ